jgi:hypothetical protein
MLCEDLSAELVLLALPHNSHTGPLEPEVESADPGEQASDGSRRRDLHARGERARLVSGKPAPAAARAAVQVPERRHSPADATHRARGAVYVILRHPPEQFDQPTDILRVGPVHAQPHGDLEAGKR